ncbi:claudin-1-like [Denticeps clupeoides]|uniref:claudin-1-like n=1 Tax=Denticeps clupeoides TaxID=299321 RepID=UPI0010A3EC77|nr:claudin-1-like [Denticeps clupeoides]
MAYAGIQLIGFTLALLGLMGLVICTCLNEWKSYTHSDGSALTSEEISVGLWTRCSRLSSGRMQCEVLDSILHQPMEIQLSRAVMIASILLSLGGVAVAVMGMRCTTCLEEEKTLKDRVAAAGGGLIVLGGLCALGVVSWYADQVVKDFHDAKTVTRFTLGRALFLGWAGALLSVVGGALLCCSCPHSDPVPEKPAADYV